MSISDPLANDDPLTPNSHSPKLGDPELRRTNSWAKHTFDSEPFATDAWAEVGSAPLESNSQTSNQQHILKHNSPPQHSRAGSTTSLNRSLNPTAQPFTFHPPNPIAPPAEQADDVNPPHESLNQSPHQGEEQASPPRMYRTPSSPIAMAQPSSLRRQRSSSSCAIHEGSERHSPTSVPTAYGISVTPTAKGASFPPEPENEGSTTPIETADLATLRSSIISAASSGNLTRLQQLLGLNLSLSSSEPLPSAFVLANEASTNSGLTPLHFAAGRGQVDVCRWLVAEAGAMADLEDGEGETALHKAAHRGHLNVVKLLVEELKVDPEGGDNDGWTALHNAASRGWLDIVRVLIDAGAPVDAQSKHGYTALMNAASKGQLPVVNFLIKAGAAPLIRNAYAESAFDLAAGVFEILICSVLAAYEASVWSATNATASPAPSYNPFLLHQTVPVVVAENQRLAQPTLKKLSTLGNLAAGQAPRWSSKALSRNDGKTAFTSVLAFGERGSGGGEVPLTKDEVGLPLVGAEGELLLPPLREVRSGGVIGQAVVGSGKRVTTGPRSRRGSSASSSARTSSASPVSSSVGTSFQHGQADDPAWFWLSDWSVDLTGQRSSAQDGWSYATSFDAPDDEWQAEMPQELRRIIEGGAANWGGQKWVRRRRWVRLTRRRLDLPDFGFADQAHVPADAGAEEPAPGVAVEAIPGATEAGPAPQVAVDYLARAQFLAGKTQVGSDRASIRSGRTIGRNGDDDDELDKAELRKAVARLERAADELRRGMVADEDAGRRRKAEDELEGFLHQMALIRTELGPDEAGDDSDEEFLYTGEDADGDEGETRSIWTSADAAARPSSSSSVSGASEAAPVPSVAASPVATTSALPDLTPQLSRAVEFRVPTNERGQQQARTRKAVHNGMRPRTTAAWEPDAAVDKCPTCDRKFGFFQRKHHCRRCGKVFCGVCTANTDVLSHSEVVREPGYSPDWEVSPLHRTCNGCHAALAVGSGFAPASLLTHNSFFPASPDLGAASAASSDSGAPAGPASDAGSALDDCPVCGAALAPLGARDAQEAHVRECLDGGGAGRAAVHAGRYLVFRLPAGPLCGLECQICFEEFEEGDRMARLACLCYYHKSCIGAWMDRGGGCPTHASARGEVGA